MNHGNSGFNQWIRKVWIERNDLPRRQHALIDDCPRRHTRNIEKISARQSCVTNGVFRAPPDHVKLPLKHLLVGYPFAATNKNLAHKWLAQFRRVAEVKIVSGDLAPAQQFLTLAGDNFRQDLFELPALFSLIRQEDLSHAVLAWVWQMKPEPFTGVLKKGMRNLHQNTRTVAGILFATAGPPMIEVLQNGQRLIDDLVGFFTLNVDDKTDAASIMFESGIVKTLFRWQTRCFHFAVLCAFSWRELTAVWLQLSHQTATLIEKVVPRQQEKSRSEEHTSEL